MCNQEFQSWFLSLTPEGQSFPWITEKGSLCLWSNELVSDRDSRIRKAKWVGHYEYQGNGGVTVLSWRIWAKYRKSLEELQHLESKRLMKLIVRAAVKGLWHYSSDTCKRVLAGFKGKQLKPSYPIHPSRTDSSSLRAPAGLCLEQSIAHLLTILCCLMACRGPWKSAKYLGLSSLITHLVFSPFSRPWTDIMATLKVTDISHSSYSRKMCCNITFSFTIV